MGMDQMRCDDEVDGSLDKSCRIAYSWPFLFLFLSRGLLLYIDGSYVEG